MAKTRWVPGEWLPLEAAAERIERFFGNWLFAGAELQRHLRAGELQGGAVVGERRIRLKRADWQTLQLNCYAGGRAQFRGNLIAKAIIVRGTFDGRPVNGWLFFVATKGLDKLYPGVGGEAAAPAPPPQPQPEPPTRVPPGPEPTGDWKAKVEKYLSDCERRGEKIPRAPQMLKICGEKLNLHPNLRDMQQLLRNWRLSHK